MTVFVGSGARIRFDDTDSSEPVKVYVKGHDGEQQGGIVENGYASDSVTTRPLQMFRDGDIISLVFLVENLFRCRYLTSFKR